MRKGRLLSKVSRVLLATLMAGAMLSVFSEVVNATNYPSGQWVPADGSNYTPSNREGTYDITYIVIHVSEGSYQGTISEFQNPDSNVSTHYVISKTGGITAMVRDEDIAWHAGNWDYNSHSIGIEHEGYAGDPNSFTEAMYQASADLVRWLAQEYNIQLVHPSGVAPASPTNSTGIIGHNQVPDPDNPSQGGGTNHHTDPGSYWDWDHYMQLVTQTSGVPSPTITSSLRISQSGPYYVGDTITVQFTITNKGTASITFDVLTVGGRDPDDQVADFDFHENVTLNPGESYGYQGSLTLAKAGNYHFFCAYYIANPTPEEKQLLDQNNWNTSVPTEAGVTNVMDITVNPAPNLPDLTIQNINWSPASPSIGDTVTFTVIIKNQGSGKAGGFYVYYYIDNAYQDKDWVNGIDLGATSTQTFTWTAQAGSHSIKAVADADSRVTESDETNNEKTVTYAATSLADLMIESITWLPASPSVGDTITFTVTVKNRGSGKASYSYVYYYIDNAYVTSDYVNPVDPGATATETFTWTAQAGSHTIKAIADYKQQVTESDETNNQKTVTYSATSLADLVIEGITWSPANPSVGDTVTFTVTIKNQGNGKAGYSYVYYYIDNAYVTSDYVNPVDPGATATETFTWTAKAGPHTIKAIADYKEQVTESDETNNEKTVTFSTLTPDLVIQSIIWSPASPSIGDTVTFTVAIKNQGSGKAGSSYVYYYIDNAQQGYDSVSGIDPGATATETFTWTAKAGPHTIKAVADHKAQVTESNEINNEKTVTFSALTPDLVIEGITWSPSSPSIGDTVTFSVTIKNQGNGRAGSSRVYFYIDGSSKGYGEANPLDPGATVTKTFSWTAQAGSHAIKAVADGAKYIPESDENNNWKTVTFSSLPPDLVIQNITWTPSSPSIGDTVTFTVTIKNQGNGRAGKSRVYFYIDGSSKGYGEVNPLDPGATLTKTFTWSAQSGSHSIKAIADGANYVSESDESNNEKTVTFSTIPPDLVIRTITWSPASPSIGDTVTFTVTIKNQGSGRAGASRVYFYVDGSSKGYGEVNPLDPGATVTKTFSWKAQAGSHTIKAIADKENWVPESDENNNERTLIFTATLLPDLIIESIVWSPTSPSIGDTVTFTVTIKNKGSGRASASQVYYYIDGSSKGYNDVQEIGPGATVTRTFAWKAQVGSHAIKAVADAKEQVTESDETNNEKTVTYSGIAPPTPSPTPTPAPTPTPMPTPSPKPSEVSVYLYGQRTEVNIGEAIILSLSAVNLITKPTMTVQLILKVPSGMSVTSAGFIKGGSGQYTASYTVEPGDIKQIEVHIIANQAGSFSVISDIYYYFGGDKSTAEYHTTSLPVTVKSEPPVKETPKKEGGPFSCSAPAQGASPPSSGELLLGWAPLALCWGSVAGCYSILRWRRGK